MDVATQSHLTTLRALLAYRLHDLSADPNDAGAAAGDETIDDRAAVLAALDRLDAGTYGDCADCGRPIALQRLLVQPAAPRCAACQARRALVS